MTTLNVRECDQCQKRLAPGVQHERGWIGVASCYISLDSSRTAQIKGSDFCSASCLTNKIRATELEYAPEPSKSNAPAPQPTISNGPYR